MKRWALHVDQKSRDDSKNRRHVDTNVVEAHVVTESLAGKVDARRGELEARVDGCANRSTCDGDVGLGVGDMRDDRKAGALPSGYQDLSSYQLKNFAGPFATRYSVAL